jgi:hypothetical protein
MGRALFLHLHEYQRGSHDSLSWAHQLLPRNAGNEMKRLLCITVQNLDAVGSHVFATVQKRVTIPGTGWLSLGRLLVELVLGWRLGRWVSGGSYHPNW